MRKIRVLNEFNRIRINKRLKLKNRNIFDKYGIKINNFLGYIDLFYNLKDEIPEFDNFNDEINLRFKLFNEKINNFSNRNIIVEKIKKEYINENNGYKKEEVYNHIDSNLWVETNKYDSFDNRDFINKIETNNIENRKVNWINSYERRSFENINFNRSDEVKNKKENKIYLNKYYGDLKNHLWVKNIGELYRNEISMKKTYSNRMIDIKQYPFLERRIIDRKTIKNYWNKNIDEINYEDSHLHRENKISNRVEYSEFNITNRNFQKTKEGSFLTPFDIYWRKIKESRNTKIKNDLKYVQNNFRESKVESTSYYDGVNVLRNYNEKSEDIHESNIYESNKGIFLDEISYGETFLVDRYGEVNLENRIKKFSRDIFGENIVLINKDNYKILNEENYSIEKQDALNQSYNNWNYYLKNNRINGTFEFIENVQKSFLKNYSDIHIRNSRKFLKNILNINVQSNKLEKQIHKNLWSYVSIKSMKGKNIDRNLNVYKEEYVNKESIEKIILKEYLRYKRKNTFNINNSEDYFSSEEVTNLGDLTSNIISDWYSKHLNSSINNRTTLTSNIILNKVHKRYWKRLGNNHSIDNSKYLNILGDYFKNISIESKWSGESFNIKKIKSFNSKLFNSLHVKRLIKKIWNKSENSIYKLIQNSDVVYKMNESFEEINEDINELRIGNQIIINNNKRLSRAINSEERMVILQNNLSEDSWNLNQRDEVTRNYIEEKKYFIDRNRYLREKNIAMQFNSETQNYKELLNQQEKVIGRNNAQGIFNAFKQEEIFYRIHNEIFKSKEEENLNIDASKRSLEYTEKIETQIHNNEEKLNHLNKTIINNSYKNGEYSEIYNENRYETFIERVQKLVKERILQSRGILEKNIRNTFRNEMSTGINEVSINIGNSYRNNYYNSVLQGEIYNYVRNSYLNKFNEGDLIGEHRESISYELGKNYSFTQNKGEDNYNWTQNIGNAEVLNKYKSDSYKIWNKNKNIFVENINKISGPIYKKSIYEIFKSKITKGDLSYLGNVLNFLGNKSNRWLLNNNFSNNEIKNSFESVYRMRQYKKNFYNYNNDVGINDIEEINGTYNKNLLNNNIDYKIKNNYEENRIKAIEENIQNSTVSKSNKKYFKTLGRNLNKTIYNIIKNRESKSLINSEVKWNLSRVEYRNNFEDNSIGNRKDIISYNMDNYNKNEYGKKSFDSKNFSNNYEEIKKYNYVSEKEIKDVSEKIFNDSVIKNETSIKNEMDKLSEGYKEIIKEVDKKNIYNSLRINNNFKKIQNLANSNAINVKDENINFNNVNEENLLNNVNKNIRDLSKSVQKDIEVQNTITNTQKFINEEKIKNEIIKNNRLVNEKEEYFGDRNREYYNTTILRNNSLIEGESISSNVTNNIEKIENIQRDIKQIENNLKVHNINLKNGGNSSYKKILRKNITSIIRNDKKFIGELYSSESINNKNFINPTEVFNSKEVSLISKVIMPINGYKKNILRMSNINALDKSISLNVKNSNDNYENHTFKQVKNVILSNDGKDTGNNYDYATEIIFKKEETKVNQEEILKIISQNQKNMETEIRSIIDKKIKKQGDEINVPTLSSQVYRDIERKMKYEKRRKGMI